MFRTVADRVNGASGAVALLTERAVTCRSGSGSGTVTCEAFSTILRVIVVTEDQSGRLNIDHQVIVLPL